MNQITKRLQTFAGSPVKLFCASAAVTVATVAAITTCDSAFQIPCNAYATSIAPTGIKIEPALSQTKIVNGEVNTLYLTLNVDVPQIDQIARSHNPVDMVVILDRSGSMAEAKKLEYAKIAINDLVTRLNDGDRFALVTFDDSAALNFPLAAITPASRTQLRSLIDTIVTGGGTNMSSGLINAQTLFGVSAAGRGRKVLLLSDGHANGGITDPAGLAQIVKGFGPREAIVSTIGMGLSFNENLMATLADQGMGNYSYLESLEQLGTIFLKDLSDTRATYARASELQIQMPLEVTIKDASGYPIEATHAGLQNGFRIPTGQLISGQKRAITLTLETRPGSVGALKLADINFLYDRDGVRNTLPIRAEALQVAVLTPADRPAALASAEPQELRDAWGGSNLARLQEEVQDKVKDNDLPGAKQALAKFRSDLRVAEKTYNVPLSPAVAGVIEEMDAKLEESFAGSPSDQEVKRSRYAKEIFSDSRQNYRKQSVK
jgi:Ca-activated chloride channel family protein